MSGLRRTLMFGAIAALVLWSTGAAHAEPMEPMQVLSTPDAHFVSGGVGVSERDALHELANEYNLHVSFARKSDGAFLSYADVTLESSALSENVQLTTAGPYLFGSVPPGTYTLLVQVAGWKPARRTIEVAAHTPTYEFVALDPEE